MSDAGVQSSRTLKIRSATGDRNGARRSHKPLYAACTTAQLYSRADTLAMPHWMSTLVPL
jgi:hypothetical protein